MNDNADGVSMWKEGVTKCKVWTETMSEMRTSSEHKQRQ